MLPPVDDDVLRDHPEFANLYSTLTNVMLNPDASTKHDPAAKERAAVREELDKLRLSTAKHHLLERAIATASPPEPKPKPRSTSSSSSNQLRQQRRPETGTAELPESLLDLLLVLPPLLDADASLPQDSAALLLSSPPLSDLDSLLPPLATLVSSNLHSWALSLARLTHPTTNPSYLHRHIPSLPKDYADLVDSLFAARQSLAAARLRALASLTQLFRCYTQSLVHLVRSLEAKHGVLARSVELRASDVSLRAQRTELEATHAAHRVAKELYSPQAVAALRSYANHLKDAKLRTAERVRSLQTELAEYGVGAAGDEGKEKTMREMARVYHGMRRQIEDVKQDLDRLQDG
ncbi:hypothetical protein HRG_007858 [Hirsutella rhossiliensis]|uniref:Uncharacterized protein n=1 Tax=Hirsutella rhossiliensis TaxID=111463 RepID=A0A9P8MT14_9HYPO|nr:uncharacterized protein HRG_07858 [Hirsutella rhossiliensis]KAH0960705.1 hypothetical protein HRG_07858 [Hirsutella rhossiliensis]